MTRGLVPKAKRLEIDARLPDVMGLRRRALSMHPELFSNPFEPADQTPVAIVCFHDCTEALAAARIALFEYYAHGEYYRHVLKKPREMEAIFLERFFLDDAALRLYAAGEHLANAIVFMRRISDQDLSALRRSGRTSQQATVAAYLRRHERTSNLTRLIRTLGASRDWQFTIAYRNRWVHEQPPTIAGLGRTYRRRTRWIVSAGGEKRRLDITTRDAPEYDIHTLARHILSANKLFIDTAEGVLHEYHDTLAQHGITLQADGWNIRWP